MKITRYTAWTASLALLCLTVGPGTRDAGAQAMADYTTTPSFISETVPPNVLLLLDNSGSMNIMAYDDGLAAFDPTRTYNGIFDAAECYLYTGSGASERFAPDSSANPATMPAGGWTCTGNATHPWSGNLLNFAGMRRIDIAKWVMVGGICAVARAADFTCSSVKAQDLPFAACCQNQTQAIAIADVSGRMPAALIPGSGNVYFHLRGSNSSLRGKICVDNDSTQPSSSATSCQDGGTFVEGEFVIRADQLTNSTGVIQQVGQKARFGVMEFSTLGSDGGVVQARVGTDTGSLVSSVENTVPQTWTPLAESLYEASRYFAQIPPAYNAGDYTHTVVAEDPYRFVAPTWAGTDQYASCCESFVIVFTDGESTQDQNIPASLQDLAHPIHGAHCTGAGCSGHRTDYPSSGTHYLDDIAYWAHINDLRQATVPTIGETGKDLTGTQSLSVYTFYAFGNVNARELLHSTAKAGAFDDKNGDNLPDATGQTCTYPAGSPLGTGTSTSSVEWDTNADCIADAYFESSNADDMRDNLMAAITSILERSSSGSAASVLASSATGEGALYQSFFFPSTFEGLNEITWTGYTQGLFVDAFGNLREDSDGDARLVYENDLIVRTRFDSGLNQVVVDRFEDLDGNGQADSGTALNTVGLKDVLNIWEGGEMLALKSAGTRNIFTWIDQDNDGLVDGGEEIDFTTTNSTLLAPYLRPGAAPYTTDNIINFLRGQQITGLRNRQLTVGGSLKVWKLGDAIHAQPVVVGAPAQRYDIIYGDTTYTGFFAKYKDRRRVAYVGANDGMLHGFNAGFYHVGDDPVTTTEVEHGWFTTTQTGVTNTPPLGEELFGFIPQELLPHLRWLADPDYTHVYYVDLKPKATDVRIFTPDADHPDGWGTILMGGFRLGGSCGACLPGTGAPPMTVNADFNYDGDAVDAGDTRTFYSAYFVLDITNPESPNYPKLLWSFSSADLGLTTNTPSMLRVNPSSQGITDNADAKWFMLASSGPTGYDGITSQVGRMFAIDLAAGPGVGNGNVTTLEAESLNAFMGATLTVDTDFDYRVEVAYLGGVIDDSAPPWRGKLYRLTTNNCAAAPCTTGIWGIAAGANRGATELLDTFPSTNTFQLGPVAATPAVAVDDTSRIWVFAGTGRMYDEVDKTNTDQQYFVGVKDKVVNGGCTESTATNCHANDLVDVSSAQVCIVNVGNCGSSTDQVTGVTGASDFPSLIGLVKSKDGWFTTLPGTGERSLSRPLVFGGLVLFPTFTPQSDICTSAGQSTLYALYYLTGSAYSSPVIGTYGAGSETYVSRSTGLGQGLATEAVVHIGDDGGVGQASVFSENSMGQIFQLSMSTTGAIASRFMTWYMTRD